MNTEKASLDWYFHGARYYDPQLATWHTPDPLSESYSSLSPYTYVANNPVNYVDPNGMYYAKPSDWEREQAREGGYLNWELANKIAGMMGSQFGSYMDRHPSGGWEFCAPTGGYVNRFTGERMSADEFNKTYLSYSAASFSGNLLSARKIRVGTHGWISNGEVYGAPSYVVVYAMNSPWNQNTRVATNSGGESSYAGVPDWVDKTNTGIGAFMVGNNTKEQLINYAARTGDIGKTGAKYLKVVRGAGVAGSVFGMGVSGYNIYNDYSQGGIEAVNGWDIADFGAGAAGLGATIFLVSNPVGWAISGGVAIYFTVRLIHDVATDD